MGRGVLILVCLIVLFSFFETSKTNFRFWNSSFMSSPNFPVSFNRDISIFGLFSDFHSNPKSISPINDIISKTNKEIYNSDNSEIPDVNNNFGVQFAALDVYLDYFTGIDSFETYTNNGLIHYVINDFQSMSSAKDKMYDLRELGFSEAFVFTLDNNKRECYFIVKKENEDVIRSSLISNSDYDDVYRSKPFNNVVETLSDDVLFDTEINELVENSIEEMDNSDNLIESDNLNVEDLFYRRRLEASQGNVSYSFDNDGYPIKSDEQVIYDSPYIKENAKDLILKSIKNGSLLIIDVEGLLFEYAGELIMKKHVIKLIDRKS